MKKKIPKTKRVNFYPTKKKHIHRWSTDGDCCGACGAYEAICLDCDKIALFSKDGTLLDIMG